MPIPGVRYLPRPARANAGAMLAPEGAPRACHTSQYAIKPPAAPPATPRRLTLQNWPVSTRLIAVIILALLMGLVFGGLQVASATESAEEFGHVSQLAILGQQVADLVQALETERDQTAGIAP